MARANIDYGALGVPKPSKERPPVVGERGGIQIRSRLKVQNSERLAWLRGEQFEGEYAEWIRRLPCATCFPEQFQPGKPLLPVFMEMGPARRCEASHVGHSRGAGGKAWAILNQCPPCHREYEAGRESFCERRGITLDHLAQMASWLYEISPFRGEGS